jgi:transposase InsO family protein
MKFSAHPERQSRFQKTVAELHLLHGTIVPGHPWQNGIIERSHRTDNEELFTAIRFADPEDRRYQLWLWEACYNDRRPHQALGNRTPREIYLSEYHTHAACRMLT